MVESLPDALALSASTKQSGEPHLRPQPVTAVEQTRRCQTHGAYTFTRVAGCPVCAEAWRAEQQEKWERAEQARKAELHRARIEASGVQGRFLQTTFDGFVTKTAEQARAVDQCRQFVADFDREVWAPLWLIGPPGAGKTHLLSAIVLGIIDRGFSGRMSTARSAILRMRATWRKGSEESETDVIDELGHAGILALDELGVGFGSDAEITQLIDVVDLRYQLRHNVVIASNLNAKSMQAALGDRLFDRLLDNARVIRCTWPSHRNWAQAGRGGEDHDDQQERAREL